MCAIHSVHEKQDRNVPKKSQLHFLVDKDEFLKAELVREKKNKLKGFKVQSSEFEKPESSKIVPWFCF